MRILIIEDQENLARLIRNGLEAEGFAADYVVDGESGLRRITMNHKDYDLVVLDWMLPKKNGDEICREVRAQKIALPILLLTARDSAKDMIEGLDCGADDYLTKPFSFDVLVARIRAILRRPKTALPVELACKDITLNPATKKAARGGKAVSLTLKEFSLLEYLMRNKGIAVSRDQILSSIWDFAFDSFANVVDVHITNLRKKLGDKNAEIIQTVRGVGYRMSE